MAQIITTGVRTLVEVANNEVDTISVEEALALQGRHDVVFVDIRDIRELYREGRMPEAFHCPRGMLEFWIDPASSYHKPVFAEDKRFVFFALAACAPHWRHRQLAGWGLGLSPISKVASVLGKKPEDQL